MDLPWNECCCCGCCKNDCCSSGDAKNTIGHSSSAPLLNTRDIEQKQIYALHPSKRKSLSSFVAMRKSSKQPQRVHLNLVCILVVTFMSFANVHCTSDIPTSLNNLQNGESTPNPSSFGAPPSSDIPSFPTASSSSLNNVVVPGPASQSPTVQAVNLPPSVTQSYFINGYANQIQKTTATDLRALAGNKPLQLQFRTVCPFGNIINDDKFALRFNSQGYLTYLELPLEAQTYRSKNVVADGTWHSVTFRGPHVFLDDPENNESYGIMWDNVMENDTSQHRLNFFDGFVGCIRLQLPEASNASVTDSDIPAPNTALELASVLFKGLPKYQPCNDLQFDLSSAQCFHPESFILCSKCENNATCIFTDGKNECECPEPEDENVRYHQPFCTREEEDSLEGNAASADALPETRERDSASDETFLSSTTGSSRTPFAAQSSALISSTTEHVAAPSSIEQNRLPTQQVCPCVRGECVQGDPSRICDCTGTGFRGRLCNNDVCDENPSVCGTVGKCYDDPEKESGFQCYCKPGFSGDLCDINFDECLSQPCVNNGTCEDGVNTYQCHCLSGYSGKNCETEIDECESAPCQHGSTCTDQVADYICTCANGFEGKDCEINIDECDTTPCKNGGSCTDLIDAYQCNCTDTGFDGLNCEINIDDCVSSPCQNGGNCTDGIKEYACDCFDGYTGKDCDFDIPDCVENPCHNGGICHEKSNRSTYSLPIVHHLQFDYSTAAGYVCECAAGYDGSNCEIDIDECQLPESPCNDHGRCNDGVNEYSCSCDKGFEGEFCQIDVNECLPNPCGQAKDCKNLAGDYFCECNAGYGGKNCTVPLTGCITNVCYNEGSCTPLYDESTQTHSFECSCKQGYTGETCAMRTTMGFNGSSLVEIEKNDDAYANNKYYLTFFFRTTLPDVVLAVGQGGTYFSLGLAGGKLSLHSSLINNLQGMSSGNKLHDGKWHKVVVSINSSHVILSADLEQVTLPIVEVEDFAQQTTGFNLTILGLVKSSLGFLNKSHLKPFVGCMQDVKINDDRILPEEAYNVNLTNIVPSCVRKDQCNPNPCQNEGVCKDLWQKFTCSCPRPYLGGRCQYSYIAATFNHEDTENSLATVDIPSGRFGGVFDISMFVRTREPRGTIFMLCDKERGLNGSYIEATITKSGNLVVQAKWSSESADDAGGVKPEPYTVDGQLTDGYRHLLSVQRDKNFVVIKIDDLEHFRKSHTNRVFNPTVMYIGGKPAQLSSQEMPTMAALQESHSGETSTSLPDAVIDNNTEGSASDIEGGTEVTVPPEFRFKGTIQDVRVNLSSSEPAPSFGHISSHPKPQNVYIVEFFNLSEIQQIGQPLGKVTIQNLLQGSVTDDHCKSNPCVHGKCSNTWNDFKCDCFEHWDGKQCEIRLRCGDVSCPERSICKNIGHNGFECVADAAFDGKGYTTPHYVLRTSASPTDLGFSEISFRYRSKRPGNVLHMSNGTSFLRVSLEGPVNESSVVFHFLNNMKLAILNSTIFDGEWHTVAIKFSTSDIADLELTGQPISLIFDRTEQKSENFVYHASSYLKDILLSPNLDIIVGSSLSIDDYAKPIAIDHNHNLHFRGCLGDIYLGSFRLPFISHSSLEAVNPPNVNRSYIETTAPTAFYINERFHPSEEHLPRLGCVLCYEKDCKNGGQCTDPTLSYDCSCMQGYTGETCDVDIDECIDNMCAHGSTCIDGVNNYTCACAAGYEGFTCDVDIDECEGDGEKKCNEKGHCVDGIGEYKCICFEEYIGTHCEKRKKSNCRDNPCENGATCTDVDEQINGVYFQCDCPPGWEGEFCSDRIDYCKDILCENDGNCTNTFLGYRCDCVRGFDGLLCEVNIDDCASNPCKNKGLCMDGIDSFTCECNGTGFEGMTCEEDINECLDTDWYPPRCMYPQVCQNIVGSYTCSCLDKSMCGPSCNIINPCFGDGIYDKNYTCQNGGTCDAECPSEEEARPLCLCTPEYIGTHCEIPEEGLTRAPDESTVDILLIVIPVLAAILIAATVGIIILVRMARRKRATRGVYSPSQQEYCNPRVELDNVMKPPPEERLI